MAFLRLFTVSLFLLFPHEVLAHASLVKSAPARRAVLFKAPPKIQLWFSEKLEARFSATPPAIRSQVNTGGAIALVGMLPFPIAFLRRRQRRWMIGAGVVIVGAGTIIAAAAVSIDAYPTTYRRPSVPYQAISIVNGKTLCRENCMVCQGDSGYGDGPAAEDLNPRPANLTARHAADHTAGDLYWWLAYGIKETAMPGYADSLTEEERWDLINFVRALSSGRRARSLASIVETEASLIAPDFLRDQSRGKNIEGSSWQQDRAPGVFHPSTISGATEAA